MPRTTQETQTANNPAITPGAQEQVQTALENSSLVSSIAPEDVIGLLRALLQVNFSQRSHPMVREKILPVFNALRGKATASSWHVMVPFCFDLLRSVAAGKSDAPQYVVCNLGAVVPSVDRASPACLPAPCARPD